MSVAKPLTEHDIDALRGKLFAARDQLGRVIVGQREVIREILLGLLAGGHCLIEGVPGLGKTLLVRTLSQTLNLPFKRIQFTPDLMPGDIVGTELLQEDPDTGARRFVFQPGPIFTSILLADEINRTPPKTQSALLEAMAEHAVTFAGATRALPEPFFVLATQNPLEQAGTYSLPEAQLDRFLLHVDIAYPDLSEETEILRMTTANVKPVVEPVMDAEDILALQTLTREVPVSDALLEYASRLIQATRPSVSPDVPGVSEWIRWGAGPRGGQSLILAAKAAALLDGRYAVTRDDIAGVAAPVLRHRLILNFHAEAEQRAPADVIASLLEQVPPPDDPLDG